MQLYSQVADLLGNVIVECTNVRHFNLLARFHYILNLPRIYNCYFNSRFNLKTTQRANVIVLSTLNKAYLIMFDKENIHTGRVKGLIGVET